MSDTPERNRNQPKGLFYGWIVVLACFFCCFSYAIFYTLGVFFTPIRQEFGWGYALTTSIQTLHLLVFVLSTFIAGLITDRFGPRLPILLGSVCMGVGFLSLGQTQTIADLPF